ncbi:hypothetical protein EGH21_10360 [Halomicroarcula sp. F13]|uniref:DUF7979 domain-containing protein n=1 Tax=Haloarcula rubra TaxID=2487747 RepID=A0AAW4PSB2_9EURY|nr:hypothetical protein [Halomicroarcula rubra]MBX0323430.1 hypothetical protein [Halomicroarcula rubra]
MSDQPESVLFTYLAPFLGVLLVAVGIGAAVPGGYALIQDEISTCGEPTIAVEGPEETARRFAETTPQVARFDYEDLSTAEQTAFTEALTDPRGEAHVTGDFPNAAQFRNGSIVRHEGERHYVTIVSENPCFEAAPLQFPLGVFAIAFGVVGILTPPLYRKLVALERSAGD